MQLCLGSWSTQGVVAVAEPSRRAIPCCPCHQHTGISVPCLCFSICAHSPGCKVPQGHPWVLIQGARSPPAGKEGLRSPFSLAHLRAQCRSCLFEVLFAILVTNDLWERHSGVAGGSVCTDRQVLVWCGVRGGMFCVPSDFTAWERGRWG